jgi:hypothetical protein
VSASEKVIDQMIKWKSNSLINYRMCSTIFIEEHKKLSFHKYILMKLNVYENQKQTTWRPVS